MKKFLKKIIIMCLVISVFFTSFSTKSFAANEADVTSEEGMIKFVTYDTKATTGITWKTVGFNITRKTCLPNGDPTILPHATIKLDERWKKEKPYGDKVEVTFTIPKDVVDAALSKQGFDDIQNNDILYLHGIHQVMHGTTPGNIYQNLKGISNAEKWNNPDDFKDRFDIQVVYHSAIEKVYVEYRTSSGAIIETKTMPESYWAKAGESISVKFLGTKPYNGIDYKLYASRMYRMASKANIGNTWRSIYSNTLDEVQNRTMKQQVGGVKFIAYMKPKYSAATTELILTDPNPMGVIAADDRDNEQYDVLEGIPTTENLYANVFSENFLMGYKFKLEAGIKIYPVTVTKTYNLSWTVIDPKTMKSVPKTDTQIVTKTMTVERPYSYTFIENLGVYSIDNAKVNNYALPGSSTTITPSGYTPPNIDYESSAELTDHIKEPIYTKTVSLGSQTITDTGSRPDVPDESSLFQATAESKVKKILVKNDRFTIGDINILSDEYKEDRAPDPNEYEMDAEEINENVLFKSGLTIQGQKSNGSFGSDGTITYKKYASVGSFYSDTMTYPINGINNVVIHTPTVCDAIIESKIRNNQMLSPDTTVASLVLDTSFNINLPTSGDHRYIPGYGYNDYGRYIASRQVQFPFDVYQGTTYIKAGTWISLTSDITQYYLPIWVDEGVYTIRFKSESINAAANGAQGNTEALANLSFSNYVAEDTARVQVSGRVYGLNLYDISDYPTWQSAFRLPKSMKHSGFYYPVGTKDRNGADTGINPKYTLTPVNGSHPTAQTIGTIKSGYVTRFSLCTMGNMYGPDDYIRIRPTFYFVDRQGNNRQEVDVYYSETFQGTRQNFVKMGSSLDLLNTHTMRLGDLLRSVPQQEVSVTARIKQLTEKVLQGLPKEVYTYTNVMIPENMRTYIGTNYTPTGTVPAGVDPDKVTKSRQRWFGEYYIPSEIHVLPKGFDILGYGLSHYGWDYQEDFWLKDGYILVNFDIETIQNGKRMLSYINPANAANGYCNMWNMEGYQYSKTDAEGNVFQFTDGDYVLYDVRGSAAKDYVSGGTH